MSESKPNSKVPTVRIGGQDLTHRDRIMLAAQLYVDGKLRDGKTDIVALKMALRKVKLEGSLANIHHNVLFSQEYQRLVRDYYRERGLTRLPSLIDKVVAGYEKILDKGMVAVEDGAEVYDSGGRVIGTAFNKAASAELRMVNKDLIRMTGMDMSSGVGGGSSGGPNVSGSGHIINIDNRGNKYSIVDIGGIAQGIREDEAVGAVEEAEVVD